MKWITREHPKIDGFSSDFTDTSKWSGREDLLSTSLYFALIPCGYSGQWRYAPLFKFAPCKLVNL